MARDHQRPGLSGNKRNGGNRQLDEAVQGVDLALNAATTSDVDEREPRRVQDVAGNDDVGSSKKDDAVAVRVRGGLVQDLDALVVQVHVFPALWKRLGWPRSRRKRGLLPGRRAHSSQDFLG